MRASLVVHDDRGISAHVVDAGMSPAERLDVYRSTFASVVTKALRLSYPAVHRLVGAEFFEGAARIFIEAHPPESACLDDYGEKFADFLSDFEPAAWRISAALFAGRPLAAALDEAPDTEASALLADHLAAGRFIDFSLNETSA